MGAEFVLNKLEKLTDSQLFAIEECNRINMKRYLRRSALSWWSKISVALIGFFGIFGSLEKFIDIKFINSFYNNYSFLILPSIIGFSIGSFINIIISLPNYNLLKAFADIIDLAKSFRTRDLNL